MGRLKSDNSLDLVDRLGSALAGTHGRSVTTESLRTLVQMEVSEWRSELQSQGPQSENRSQLITPKSEA